LDEIDSPQMCTHTKKTPLVTVGTPPGHVPHYDDAISIASIEGSVTEPESDDCNVDAIVDASDKSDFREELEGPPYNQLGLPENQLYWADINRHVDIKEGIF